MNAGTLFLPAVLAVALLAGCTATPSAPPTTAPTSSGAETPDAGSAEAAAYCADQGGTVQERQPTFGTNNDESTCGAGLPTRLRAVSVASRPSR